MKTDSKTAPSRQTEKKDLQNKGFKVLLNPAFTLGPLKLFVFAADPAFFFCN
jgi:hypothetical protein